MAQGPLRVVSHIGPMYTLLDLTTNRQEEVHIKRLRPFNYNPEKVNPIEVANAEKQLWTVEKKVQHQWSPKCRTTMSFLVKWRDIPDKLTWKP